MSSLSLTLVIALGYFVLFIFINNYSLVYSTLFGTFPLTVKAAIIFSMVTGFYESMSMLNSITLVIISLLTGVNGMLLSKSVKRLQANGTIQFAVGGSSIMGIASSGCASCGLPILAFFGLSSSVGILPLKGYEFSLITIVVLLVSTYVLVKQLHKRPQCTIS